VVEEEYEKKNDVFLRHKQIGLSMR
jgi:hypothetical protein